MLDYMKSWVQDLGPNQRTILAHLSKESVRAHNNTRGSQGGGTSASQAQPMQVQQNIQGFIQGIPGVPQMLGLNTAGRATGIGREVPNEQSGTYYSRPETSTYGSMYSGTSSYAPPPGPPQPASGYAPSSPYGQPSQGRSPFHPHPTHSHHTSSYTQPPSTTSFHGASSPYTQGAPGGYRVPSPSVPSAGGYSSGGYPSADGYSESPLRSPPVSSYLPPSGPPPGDFGGFPDERRILHGEHGHGHGHSHGPGFPEGPEFEGQPPFPDNRHRFGDREGYPPRGDPYQRW